VLLIEFLNRISFFSALTWGFFFIAAVCAILLTTLRSPLLRRYRRALIATATSAILLGVVSWSLPVFLSRLNPDQSRLTPIDQLITTEWIEPVSNPEIEVSEEEISWAKPLGYQFKYKLRLGYELQKALVSGAESLVLLDQKGNLHGFNAYSGLNHWLIPLRLNQLLDTARDSKKLYLLERTSLDAIRVSCIDFINPALLWQRTLPRSKEGSLLLDSETQTLLISSGTSGIWALKSKTGEILWKRPELYSKTKALLSPKHLVIFEPSIAGRTGHWYFLDSSSGKTLQKTPHVYPDLKRFIEHPPLALGQVDDENFFLMNPADLSQAWSFHADAPVRATEILLDERFLQLQTSSLLELRTLPSNELKWQKKVTPSTLAWVKFSPDQERIAIPSDLEGESRSISFYQLNSGEYLGSAHTSEALTDLYYLGDWVYLMSENHVWAIRKAY
jgi:outer membrane protein assembly factor BamB